MFEKHLVHDDEDVRGTIDMMDLYLLDLLNSTSNIACQFHIAMHVPYIQLWCLCRSSIVRLSGEQSNHQMFSLSFEFLGGTTTFVGLVDMVWHNMSIIIFYKLHGSLACSDLSTNCFCHFYCSFVLMSGLHWTGLCLPLGNQILCYDISGRNYFVKIIWACISHLLM